MDFYPRYAVNGQSNAILANRVSFFFNLQGASIALDTACSASLVGFHLGVQTLLGNREADLSIVVGSALDFMPNTWQIMTDLGLLSSDGRCRAFDAKGTGYVRGEGVCAVILKRAGDARAEGERIRALVRATGTNHDGLKSAIGLPSAESQERLIRSIYAKARLNPDDTQFFEAHGTGTKAGDPREAKASGAVFGTRSRSKPLFLGSVKTNIGHLEGAAGLIGVIKTVIALENRKIPPNMLFDTPNPDIQFQEWKLEVPTAEMDWVAGQNGLRRASINSFGYGGANAHVVLESCDEMLNLDSAVDRMSGVATKRPFLLPLTAHSEESGKLLLASLNGYVQSHQKTNLLDLAHTLSTRCTMHQTRTFAIASDLMTASQQLRQTPSPSGSWTVANPSSPQLCFIFTGQGARTFSISRQLIELYPPFVNTLRRADTVLQSLADISSRHKWSILDELQRTEATTNLGRAQFSQPICTAVQLALVDLLEHWGINPAAVCGHSSGEIAAAYAAGNLSFEAAVVTAYYRGLHMGKGSRTGDGEGARAGAMVAVGLSDADARIELSAYKGRLRIAAVNSPRSVTISGDKDAALELLGVLVARNVFARRLNVDQAFHSHHMVPLAGGYLTALMTEPIFQTPETALTKCPMFSSVTGDSEAFGALTMEADYWVENMVQPVRFADAVSNAIKFLSKELEGGGVIGSNIIFVEVGPHPALKGPVREVLASLTTPRTNHHAYIATLDRNKPAFESVLACAGHLFTHGCCTTFHPIPGITSTTGRSLAQRVEYLHRPAPHSLLGARVPESIATRPRWRNFLRLSEVTWLKEHVFEGKALFPGAGYISMAIEAVLRQGNDRSGTEGIDRSQVQEIRLKEVSIKAPLTLSDSETGSEVFTELSPLRTSARGVSDEWFEFSVSSYDESGSFTENSTGLISVTVVKRKPLAMCSSTSRLIYDTLCRNATRRVRPDTLFSQIHNAGLFLGDRFRLVDDDVYCAHGFVAAPITFLPSLYSDFEQAEGTALHPTILDSAFQSTFCGIEECTGTKLGHVFVPTYAEKIRVSGWFARQPMTRCNGPDADKMFTIANCVDVPNPRVATSNVEMRLQGSGELVLEIEVLEMTAMGGVSTSVADPRTLCFREEWKPCFAALGAADDTYVPEELCDLLGLYQFQYPMATILLLVSTPEATLQVLRKLLPAHGACSQQRSFASLRVAQLNSHSSEWLHHPAWTDVKKFCDQDGVFVEEPDAAVDSGGYDLVIQLDSTALPSDIKYFVNHKSIVIDMGRPKPVGDWACVVSCENANVYRYKATRASAASPNAEEVALIDSKMFVIAKAFSSRRTEHIIQELQQHQRVDLVGVDQLDNLAKLSYESLQDADAIVVLEQLDEDEGDISDIFTAGTWPALQSLLALENKTLVWVLQGATMDCPNPNHAKIIGLLRVARNENHSLRIIIVDIESSTSGSLAVKRILQPLCLASPSLQGEEDISDRSGTLYLSRVTTDDTLNAAVPANISSTPTLAIFSSYPALTLTIPQIGLLETLAFTADYATLNTPLPPSTIEIQVTASALNFRDLATATGIITDRTTLGDECAGVVVAVGAGVTRFRPGDRVAACRPGQGAHATFLRQPEEMCARIPDEFTDVEAASFSGVLATAWYALVDIARLRRGETVLVHCAAGGVGQMAVQIAKSAGARVLATCGSEAKRGLLINGYGIPGDDIFSSRDVSFVEGVMKATDGRGADVVLNSLAGELLKASWRCVAPFGRFLEIGKRDIHENASLEMGVFRRNVMFASVDLVRIYEDNRPLAVRIFDAAADLFFSGGVKPVQSIVEFGYDEVEKAFRLMQRGKHAGKIILVPQPDDVVRVVPSPPSALLPLPGLFHPEKTYLLVGGLGGLGTVLAEWMCRRGCRQIAFFSRSPTEKSLEAQKAVSWLESRGVVVSIYEGDVTAVGDVTACISSIGASLAGIFHAATMLSDALLQRMTHEQWMNVLKAKCQGARNLHDATLSAGVELDMFVCFSSTSAVVGNKGQGNYGAANAYLDALMASRRAAGLCGSSMNIGAVDGSRGMVGSSKEIRESMLRMKHELIDEWEFLFQVERTVLEATSGRSGPSASNGQRQGAGGRIITGINVKAPDAFWTSRSLFRNLYANRTYSSAELGGATGRMNLAAALSAEPDSGVRGSMLLDAFLQKVAAVLGVELASVSPTSALSAYGLDSIVAVEFRKWFKEAAGVDVALFDVNGRGSIIGLTQKAAAGISNGSATSGPIL